MNNKTFEERLAASIPLAAYQSLIRRPAIGLVYHAVSQDPPDYIRHIYPVKSPGEFEQDLLYLKENFNPISYDQLLANSTGASKLPPRAILISFDDGYRECFTEAAPLLRKHEVPCVFFLTTGFLDNRAMFYRNQYSLCVEAVLKAHPPDLQLFLKEMNERFAQQFESEREFLAWLRRLRYSDAGTLEEVCGLLGIDIEGLLQAEKPYLIGNQVQGLIHDGFSIGAHSVHHPKFIDLSREAIQSEIITSCERISSMTGMQDVPFAFPFSGFGIDRSWLAELRQDNPIIGLFFETQGLRPEASFVFNRIWADPPADPPRPNSNLDTLIHAAYQEYALWRRKYYASMIRYKLRFGK